MTRENIFAIRLGSPSQRRDQAGLTGSILFCRSSLIAPDGTEVAVADRETGRDQSVQVVAGKVVIIQDGDGWGNLHVGDEFHQALPWNSTRVTIGEQDYTFQYRR